MMRAMDLVDGEVCIRTSDCRAWRRCMRKGQLSMAIGRNLGMKGTENNINFWFGSAIHFAMEDFFGYNRFGDPRKALEGYYNAFKEEEKPEFAEEHFLLGLQMLDYFLEWYPRHNSGPRFETVWLSPAGEEVPPHTKGARPLVEESFVLGLPVKAWIRMDTLQCLTATEMEYLTITEPEVEGFLSVNVDMGAALFETSSEMIRCEYKNLNYHGTVDRIVVDKSGQWWIVDYKTAKRADTGKLDTDDQITRYLWALEQWFQRPIAGFVYLQLTKEAPSKLKRLKGSGEFSSDKKQKVSVQSVRKQLIEEYGTISAAPAKMIKFLNTLAADEDSTGDRFVRWDFVKRTAAEKAATYHHIISEAKLMSDPYFRPYISPTKDCSWDCNFRPYCLHLERGEMKDAHQWLVENCEARPRRESSQGEYWQDRIRYPERPHSLEDFNMGAFADETADVLLNLILPEEYQV